MSLSKEDREAFNALIESGGKTAALLHRVSLYVNHLENDNAALVNLKNEVVRENNALRDKIEPLKPLLSTHCGERFTLA